MEQQTILIVDDDREIVRVIAKILELEGYRTLKLMMVSRPWICWWAMLYTDYDRYHDAEDEWSCSRDENTGDQ